MKNFNPLLSFFLIGLVFISCNKEEEEIVGCTDSLSYNYNPDAISEDIAAPTTTADEKWDKLMLGQL